MKFWKNLLLMPNIQKKIGKEFKVKSYRLFDGIKSDFHFKVEFN